MWLLSFLPNWIIHATVLLGLLGIFASIFLKVIPMIRTYATAIGVASYFLLATGLFLEGGLADYAAWEARVKELEAKVAAAEAESAKQNTKLVEKVVTKTQYIKQRADTIYVEIDKNKENLDKICKLPKEFIVIHNKAAEQPK